VRKGGGIDEAERARNHHSKSKVRARVEHVFAMVKRLWGFMKVRYRGLAKNATRALVPWTWRPYEGQLGQDWPRKCATLLI